MKNSKPNKQSKDGKLPFALIDLNLERKEKELKEISTQKNIFTRNQGESGVTLVALIITIIVLIILAVVSLNVMFNDRIIDVATDGVENYVSEQEKEQKEFNNAVEYINSAVCSIDEINKVLLLGEVTMEKDLDESRGNWIELKTSAIGRKDDKLDYTLKLWKKENEEVDENELIKGIATKEIVKEDVRPGEEVSIKIEGLEEYTEYLYRLEVSNKEETVKGQVKKVRTYCSGTSLQCVRYKMSFL